MFGSADHEINLVSILLAIGYLFCNTVKAIWTVASECVDTEHFEIACSLGVKKSMHVLHTYHHPRYIETGTLRQRLRRLVVNIRLLQRGIDHFIPRPAIIPFVWHDDLERPKRA